MCVLGEEEGGVVARFSSHRGCADAQPSGTGRMDGDGGGAAFEGG